MANFFLTGGNKWAAEGVYDETLGQGQHELNAAAAAVGALVNAANNGKILGIVDGQLAAVEAGPPSPDGDEVSY